MLVVDSIYLLVFVVDDGVDGRQTRTGNGRRRTADGLALLALLMRTLVAARSSLRLIAAVG